MKLLNYLTLLLLLSLAACSTPHCQPLATKPEPPCKPTSPPPEPVEANPVGVWTWRNKWKLVPIHADGTIGKDHNQGTWKWIDQTARTLQIHWGGGWIDNLTISYDGKTMKVVNNLGERFTVHLLPPKNEYAPASPE